MYILESSTNNKKKFGRSLMTWSTKKQMRSWSWTEALDANLLGRLEKFYSDRKTWMIEGEERYHAKLLSLLWIT